MKPKLMRILIIPVVVFCISAGLREAFRGSQYKLGMSIAEVRSLSGYKYPIIGTGLYYPYPVQPDSQQMLHDEVCYMYDDNKGIALFFNHYNILIEKKRIKFFGINLNKAVDFWR
jgi:hypothetical protein